MTSVDRERSQADALAQQDEDRLRGEPISKLSELSSTHEAVLREVNANGTTYDITSTAKYISDKTATSSCNSTTAQADYIETASTVTWRELEVAHGKPVVETSIVSPPPASALIVQVLNQKGEAVPEMNVAATGPSNISTKTHTNGCAILAVEPGEYKLNVSRPGFIDESGYEESEKDPLTNSSFYVVAVTSVKKSYRFAEAGGLEIKFSGSTPAEGDSFVAVNTEMKPTSKTFGKVGTYSKEIVSGKILFPFSSNYAVYAGTCEANDPHVVNPENPEPLPVSVPPGGTGIQTVVQPPIKIKVMSGKNSTSPGFEIEGATVKLTDTGCNTIRESKTNKEGALEHPGAPYGKYELCVTGGNSGGKNGSKTGLAKDRKYTTTFTNNTTTGPSELATMTNGGLTLNKESAIIYTESGAMGAGKLEAGESC